MRPPRELKRRVLYILVWVIVFVILTALFQYGFGAPKWAALMGALAFSIYFWESD